MDITTIRLIISLGFNSNSKIGTTEESIKSRKKTQTFEDHVLQFMKENKRILNVHEKKIAEFENFQANTTMFQTNINATLRNLETQLGQLALTLQSQTKNTFPSNTEVNP